MSSEEFKGNPSSFKIENSSGLAPFEEESSILLDEYPELPNLLEEFEETLDTVFLVEPFSEEGEGGEPYEEALLEEKGEEGEEGEKEEEGEVLEEEAPSEEEELFPEEIGVPPQPKAPVVGFVCRHAVDLGRVMDSQGRMAGRSLVHLIGLPCAGMVKPSWIEGALARGASGVLVVACRVGTCHHRRGACIVRGRFYGWREPALKDTVDRSRVKLIHTHPLEREGFLSEVETFLLELGKLDERVNSRSS